MKRFDFRLQKVLNYKNQILDSLKSEHSMILMQIYKQENIIEELNNNYSLSCSKCNEEKHKAVMKLENIMQYDAYLDNLNKKIELEETVLEAVRQKEEKKRSCQAIIKNCV